MATPNWKYEYLGVHTHKKQNSSSCSTTCRVMPFNIAKSNTDKVITTMVIRPHDDRTYCARSAFTHLGLWQKLYNCSLHHFTVSQFGCNLKVGLSRSPVWGIGDLGDQGFARSVARLWVHIRSPLTHAFCLVPFLSCLAGSESVSARPFNDSYCSRSYCFIEQQKNWAMW